MRQRIIVETLPVFVLEIGKDETDLASVAEIVARLKTHIDADEVARFIGVFDHYAHTRHLPVGVIDEAILDAWIIVFCFGIALPGPEALAFRPRSIGVAELTDRFVVSFLEAPMPVANTAIETWVRDLASASTPASAPFEAVNLEQP